MVKFGLLKSNVGDMEMNQSFSENTTYQFIQSEDEVNQILEYIGRKPGDFQYLYVSYNLLGADIGQVWGTDSIYLSGSAERIK